MHPCVLGGFNLKPQCLQPFLVVFEIRDGYLKGDVVNARGLGVYRAISPRPCTAVCLSLPVAVAVFNLPEARSPSRKGIPQRARSVQFNFLHSLERFRHDPDVAIPHWWLALLTPGMAAPVNGTICNQRIPQWQTISSV